MRFLDIDFERVIDWTSIKMNGVCVFLAISGGGVLVVLSLIATGTTIIHNVIRIYKELKKKNNEKDSGTNAKG